MTCVILLTYGLLKPSILNKTKRVPLYMNMTVTCQCNYLILSKIKKNVHMV